MARVEICSHCWNYSRLLTYQLSSIWLYPPVKNRVDVVVCYSSDDEKTMEVLAWFAEQEPPENVHLRVWRLETNKLMRRAIGRNERAMDTRADYILFSDVDMLFGPGAVDGIVDAWLKSTRCIDGHGRVATNDPPADLVYPRYVGKCDHARGDEYIADVTAPGLYDINTEDFCPHRYRRAIGGVQYVHGDVAREKGYLPAGHRHLRPAGRWIKTNDDVCARRHMVGHRGVPIQVPNIYRIRHSQYGRTHVGVEN